jgi:two-component system, chemotaxis family, chemotaxis protein CheY
VLVVDDDDAIRLVVCDLLSLHGCRVVEACNGAEALEVLAADRSIDVILLDLMMPVLDGRATLERLQNDLELAAIPVVVMTASSPFPAQLPPSRVLAKPFSVDALLEVVQRLAPARVAPPVAAQRCDRGQRPER